MNVTTAGSSPGTSMPNWVWELYRPSVTTWVGSDRARSGGIRRPFHDCSAENGRAPRDAAGQPCS